jgi:hypothetical protein
MSQFIFCTLKMAGLASLAGLDSRITIVATIWATNVLDPPSQLNHWPAVITRADYRD